MKTLIDGTEVSARSYYFMLDFNERNERTEIFRISGQHILSKLNKIQYYTLMKIAFESELASLETL